MTAPTGTTAIVPTPRATALGVATLVVVSTLPLLLMGNVALAFVPVLAIAVAYALWVAPMRVVMLGVLAIAMAAENPSERPFTGEWHSPLHLVGSLFYDNWNNVFPVAALRFSGLDLIVITLTLLAVVRIARAERDAVRRLPSAPVTGLTLAAGFATVLGLELWGLARGGDFRNSLWQVRELLWLPVFAGLFMYALRGMKDYVLVARIIVGAACVKVAFGLWFLMMVARPQGLNPAYVTTHGDSALFAVTVAICVACWLQRPSRRHLALNLTVTPWILLGIAINNRRLAFVSLFGAMAVMYLLLEGRLKRRINLAAIWVAPFFALYLAVGAGHRSGIFAPAASIVSVFKQKDSSSETRDIENYNLLATLKANPVVGSGFGHEYLELSKADDISHAFAQYKYIAHNSVLWLWSIAGLVGFTLIWLMPVTGVFLATRSYPAGRGWRERVTATTIVAIVLAYVVQAWGDMGATSWVGTILLSVALAVAGQLSVATGGWPSARAGATT